MSDPYTNPHLQSDRGNSVEALANGESGIALLLTIMLMLLVSAIGVSALNRAGDETVDASSSRRQVTNVAAADAALKIASEQLLSAQAGAAPASTPIYFPNFVTDQNGLSTSIRSGTIGDPNPQAIVPIGVSSASGGDLRVGRGSAPRLIYRVNVVATDPSGGNVELQAQYSIAQY